MKNMKIRVENNLDEIVEELNRLGFSPYAFEPCMCDGFVYVFLSSKDYGTHKPWHINFKTTTIAELKEM